MKNDGRLDSNYLLGQESDRIKGAEQDEGQKDLSSGLKKPDQLVQNFK